MRSFIVATALLVPFASSSVVIQTAAAAETTAAGPIYSTADTEIGTLLDDPEARAIVDKHIPGFSKGGNVDMARSFTLRAIQQHAPDQVTEQALEKIDADLAKLTAKK